jgi:threonine/homoserine/homoserine lactone efflux protein
MIETTSLLIFMGASLALLLVPGPAVLYIVARSVDQGRTAGLVSVWGIGVGSLVHVTAAAVGLSALLLQSAVAFMAVKYLGAAYLIYLGIMTLRRESKTVSVGEIEKKPLKRIFRQGIVVNVLNPKTALFFFAFLPQFVDAGNGSVTLQILMLGMIFTTMAILTDSGYAIVSGTLSSWLKGNQGFMTMQKKLSGGIYILLGMTTALAGSDSK